MLLRSVRGKSPRDIVRHVGRRVARWADADSLDFPLLPTDVSDSLTLPRRAPRRADADAAPSVAWLVVPPGAGSGGHTTLFRMMRAAADAGIRNTLLFYDRYNGDFERNAAVVRAAWPWLDAEIRPVGDRIEGFDACVASSWQTAHVLAARGARDLAPLYFVQDFEPYFYPRGAMFALAEDSYRFGFRTIALGEMVRACLADEVGLEAETVPFGCDTETYRVVPSTDRRAGVVFYAKRGNDRRGFSLAMGALAEFHRTHPDQPIHVYGDDIADAPFPIVSHGRLEPDALNDLYNSVIAGLALSFTNISLVAEEMLAAGVVPIVNDSRLARADLPNPWAAWATATPRGLADALGAAVDRADPDATAREIAASVVGRSWDPTGASVAAIIRDELSR